MCTRLVRRALVFPPRARRMSLGEARPDGLAAFSVSRSFQRPRIGCPLTDPPGLGPLIPDAIRGRS
jgi:hypothetical protein